MEIAAEYSENAKRSFARKQYTRAANQCQKARVELDYVKSLVET